MAIQGLTLGTQRGLTNDMLIAGIIDSVVTVNQFYQLLPFKGIQGNALAYNREESGFDQQNLVDVLRTGVTGINKDQQHFTRHSTELTTIIGDAQINGLVQAVGSDYNDATAVQIAAKAKGLGRRYMDLLINGDEGASALVTGTANRAPAVETAGSTIIGTGATNTGVTTTADWVAIVSRAAAVANDSKVNAALSTLSGTNSRQGTAANNDALVIDNKSFAFPFTSGTAAAEALTVSGAAAYNAALRIIFSNLGFDGLNRFAEDSGRRDASPFNAVVSNGDAFINRLDHLIDLIHDKDGMVDYIMMNSAGVRRYTQSLRLVGSAGYDDVMEIKMSSGGLMKVQSYRGVPIFRNDFIGTANGSPAGIASLRAEDTTTQSHSDIYVGTIDDGSFTHGICGLTALKAAGLQVQKLGAREEVDADITRLKWYCGLAHFSELGLIKGQI